MTHTGVCGVRNAQASRASTFSAPLISSNFLNPSPRKRGVVAGLMVRLPTNTASTSKPEWNASMPNPTWNSSGSKKGTALMEARNSEPPYMVTRKVGTWRASRRIIGHRARLKCRSAYIKVTTPVATRARVSVVFTCCAPIISMAQTRLTIATEVAIKPGVSNGRRVSSLISGIMRSASTMAISPSGTLIKKIQRQLA